MLLARLLSSKKQKEKETKENSPFSTFFRRSLGGEERERERTRSLHFFFFQNRVINLQERTSIYKKGGENKTKNRNRGPATEAKTKGRQVERLRLPPHLARSFSLCRRGPSLLLLPLPLLLRPLLPQVPRLQGREHDASPDGDGLQRGGGGGFGGGGGGCYLLLLFFPPKIEKRLVREKLRKRRGLLTHSRPSTTTKHAHAFAPLDITRAHRLQRDASGSRPAAARSHGTRRGRAWGGGKKRWKREVGDFLCF